MALHGMARHEDEINSSGLNTVKEKKKKRKEKKIKEKKKCVPNTNRSYSFFLHSPHPRNLSHINPTRGGHHRSTDRPTEVHTWTSLEGRENPLNGTHSTEPKTIQTVIKEKKKKKKQTTREKNVAVRYEHHSRRQEQLCRN